MGWSGYEIVGVIPEPCCAGWINEGSDMHCQYTRQVLQLILKNIPTKGSGNFS